MLLMHAIRFKAFDTCSFNLARPSKEAKQTEQNEAWVAAFAALPAASPAGASLAPRRLAEVTFKTFCFGSGTEAAVGRLKLWHPHYCTRSPSKREQPRILLPRRTPPRALTGRWEQSKVSALLLGEASHHSLLGDCRQGFSLHVAVSSCSLHNKPSNLATWPPGPAGVLRGSAGGPSGRSPGSRHQVAMSISCGLVSRCSTVASVRHLAHRKR